MANTPWHDLPPSFVQSFDCPAAPLPEPEPLLEAAFVQAEEKPEDPDRK